MNETMIMELGRDAFTMMMVLSLPLLGVSLLIGLIVSLIQAITQIQEVTLTFVPKIIGVIAVFALLGPWMLQQMLAFTTTLLNFIPRL
ncbi:MAG: flagellar biosynthesis protein FliQ [Caldilineaceae bacterium]|nr:flagellar biosynthesis protein FliQ [Caldilineaceae bacterium]